MRVWLPLLFLVLSSCQAPWQTLRTAQEERLAAVLDAGDEDLPAGWEWHNAWLEQTTATITYGPEDKAPDNCAVAPLCITLHHPSRRAPGDLVAGEFALRLASAPTGTSGGYAQEVAQRLARRLSVESGFWEDHRVWAMTLVEGALALVLLVLLMIPAVLRSRLRTLTWGGLVTLGGFAIRAFLMVPGPFHENHHGLVSVHNVVGGGPPFHHVTSAHFALLQWPVKWLGGGEEAVFFLGAFIGALAAPAWAVLVARLFGDKKAGWVALAIWTCMPLAVRMAPTESPFVLATLLLPGAALALGWGARLGAGWQSLAAILLGTILVALLCQCRVLTVLFLPVPALLGISLVGKLRGRHWGVLAASCLASAALVWPHFMDILSAAALRMETERYIAPANLLVSLLQGRMLMLRPDVVAPTVLPLAVMGVASLWSRGRLVSASTGLAVGWMVLVTGLVSTCTSLHFALELPLLGLLGALMAGGCVAVSNGILRPLARRLVMVLLAASILLSWPVFRLIPPDTQEYRFLLERVIPYVAESPGGKLRVGGQTRGGREPIPLSWWRGHLPGIEVRVSERDGLPEAGALVYRGLSDEPMAAQCPLQAGRSAPSGSPAELLRQVVELPGDRFLCVGYCPRAEVVLRLTGRE